jgi:hypothetical protein
MLAALLAWSIPLVKGSIRGQFEADSWDMTEPVVE